MTDVRSSPPRTATPGCTATGRGTRSPRCCSATAPAAASTPADLAALAAALPRNGISVVRVEQPWRVAGKKLAPRPAVLDECFVAAADKLRVRTPLVVGGRSAGARSAARTARAARRLRVRRPGLPAAPAGPARESRAGRAAGPRGADAGGAGGAGRRSGRPEEFPADVDLTVVPGADHGFRVPKRGPVSQEEAMAIIVEATLESDRRVEVDRESIRR